MFSGSVRKVIESDINQAPLIVFMVDEATDVSEKTQFTIVLR